MAILFTRSCGHGSILITRSHAILSCGHSAILSRGMVQYYLPVLCRGHGDFKDVIFKVCECYKF